MAMAGKMSTSATQLLVEEGSVRQRHGPQKDGGEKEQLVPPDWDPDLPYGGRVYLARRKKPDPWWVTAIEVTVIILTVAFCYYAYYHFDNLHFHVAHGYAHLGFASAQHQVGQKLLKGIGVDKDEHLAMEWFKKASDQGHAYASYNLAVGHMKKIRTDLVKKGEAHHLIQHAAMNGVKKAVRVLEDICTHGRCDD